MVIGAGGFGRECADIVKAMELHSQDVKFLWLLDDNEKLWGTTTPEGFEILTSLDKFQNAKEVYFVVGVGDPKVRRAITERAIKKGFKPISIIHPSVIFHTGAEVSKEGVVIQAGVILAINCKIGSHTHLNFGVVIGHDAIVEDYCTLNPKAGTMGFSRIKEGSYIGGGAFIMQEKTVGKNCVIGAQAFVNKDIEYNSTAVGIPAKVIKKSE